MWNFEVVDAVVEVWIRTLDEGCRQLFEAVVKAEIVYALFYDIYRKISDEDSKPCLYCF